jgi:hypothetical protein
MKTAFGDARQSVNRHGSIDSVSNPIKLVSYGPKSSSRSPTRSPAKISSSYSPRRARSVGFNRRSQCWNGVRARSNGKSRAPRWTRVSRTRGFKNIPKPRELKLVSSIRPRPLDKYRSPSIHESHSLILLGPQDNQMNVTLHHANTWSA